jgi:hypothetical protein
VTYFFLEKEIVKQKKPSKNLLERMNRVRGRLMDEKEENKEKREPIDLRSPVIREQFFRFVDRHQKKICVLANQPTAKAKSELIAFYRSGGFFVAFEGVVNHLLELGPIPYWIVEHNITPSNNTPLIKTISNTTRQKIFLEIYAGEAEFVNQKLLIAATVTEKIDRQKLKKAIEKTIFSGHDLPLRFPISLLRLCSISFRGRCSSGSPMRRYLSEINGV